MPSLQEEISSVILTRIRARRKILAASGGDRRSERLTRDVPRLREATFSDFSKVAKLKESLGLAPDSIENWERLWRQNPSLAPGDVSRPIGWVLETGSEIVGYLGSIHLQCHLGDRRLSAVAAHGFVVEPPYRALALSLAGAFYTQKEVDLYLSTSAIEATGKMALLFKAARVPQPEYDTVYFWVLRSYPFARAVARKLHLHPVMSRIGSLGISFVIGAHRLLRNPRRRGLPKPMDVKPVEVEAIDQDFLSLWHQKTQESRRLFADRSPETLKWHFQVPGDQGSVTVLACSQRGTLHGYAVVRTDTDRKNGLRKSVVADMLVRNDDAEVIRALFLASYDYAAEQGSDVLEVQGFPPQLRAVFSEFRPHSRKYPACPYYFKAADPRLQKDLEDPSAWYACPYDGDATLIRPSYPSSLGKPTPEVNTLPDDSKLEILVGVGNPQLASPNTQSSTEAIKSNANDNRH
jgi:hypothetical protein